MAERPAGQLHRVLANPIQLHAGRSRTDHGDERLQDIVGPLADRVDPRIAHHPLVRFVAEVGLPAEDLDRVVDDRPEMFGGEHLQDGRFEHVIFGPAIDEGRALHRQRLHRESVGRHVGDLLFHQLELGERLLKLDPALGVLDRRLDADFGRPGATRAERRAAEVEDVSAHALVPCRLVPAHFLSARACW